MFKKESDENDAPLQLQHALVALRCMECYACALC